MSEPRLMTVVGHIASVAARWRAQYEHGGRWTPTVTGDSRVTYERLMALPVDATPADVAGIIGNTGWIGFRCDGCGEQVEMAVEVGAPADYESATATLCATCLEEAAALIRPRVGSPEGGKEPPH